MAKHRRKVEARQLQEAIETGMVQAKGLGKKKRREASKSGWRARWGPQESMLQAPAWQSSLHDTSVCCAGRQLAKWPQSLCLW
jgi:hypothetical protein